MHHDTSTTVLDSVSELILLVLDSELQIVLKCSLYSFNVTSLRSLLIYFHPTSGLVAPAVSRYSSYNPPRPPRILLFQNILKI